MSSLHWTNHATQLDLSCHPIRPSDQGLSSINPFHFYRHRPHTYTLHGGRQQRPCLLSRRHCTRRSSPLRIVAQRRTRTDVCWQVRRRFTTNQTIWPATSDATDRQLAHSAPFRVRGETPSYGYLLRLIDCDTPICLSSSAWFGCTAAALRTCAALRCLQIA